MEGVRIHLLNRIPIVVQTTVADEVFSVEVSVSHDD